MVAPVDYLLGLGDDALILGQRNAQWCGHGPVIEEDIALTNMSLDLIGQARMLYQLAAQRINADAAQAARFAHLRGAREGGRSDAGLTEDTLAYFRDAHEFLNHTLVELPHHGPLAATATGHRDYATTTVRNFLFSARMVLLWEALSACADDQLAAIAAKSGKEARYHLRHSHDWLVRLGDGTDESHRRMQSALDHLLPYTNEFWAESAAEAQARQGGAAPDPLALRADWDAMVDDALAEATLRRPQGAAWLPQGKQGVHSEHMGFLLADMQGLARAHPTAQW